MVVAFVLADDAVDIQTQGYTYGAHGVAASHPLRMRQAQGSNPCVSRRLEAARKALEADAAAAAQSIPVVTLCLQFG